MRVLVLSDTHLGPSRPNRRLPHAVFEAAVEADVILHAGDVVDASVLRELGLHAPVHAVLGNNDHGLGLPERLVVEVGGATVAMIHDSGTREGRAARLRRWFPDADVVVFGHSHLPWHEIDRREADDHVQHSLNPGSPTERRRAPAATFAWLEIDHGGVADIRHVDV